MKFFIVKAMKLYLKILLNFCKDRKEILTDFLCSKTGKALYDEKQSCGAMVRHI
ncbi:hypothetical protein CC1_30600 [Coprococcus catus GD/7]|uniref:Uncharacterized protein n=1 Tax=Coprococcus catus GD/7 TaxID=717962 RepID=D4JBA3_9FIRM|nr:hypothetical protein CC1_30600 [Coprococcus catus GD/7]